MRIIYKLDNHYIFLSRIVGLYFAFVFSFGYLFNLYLLSVIGLVLVFVLHLFRESEPVAKLSIWHIPIIVWLCIWLVSSLYSANVEFALKYVAYLIVIAISMFFLYEDTRDYIRKYLMVLCGIHVAIILIQSFNYQFVEGLSERILKPEQFIVANGIHSYSGALCGITGQSAAAAMYCTVFIICVLVKGTKIRRWYLLIVPPFIDILLTQKRSFSLITLFLVVFTEVFLTNKRITNTKIIRKKITFICFVGIFIFIIYYLAGTYFDVTGILNKINRGSDSGRAILRSKMVELFLDYPIFGCGLYSTDAIFGMTGHNIYLQLLCENGIIAAFFFAFCFIGLVVMIFTIHVDNETTLFAKIYLLFILIYGLCANPIYEYDEVIIMIYSYICLSCEKMRKASRYEHDRYSYFSKHTKLWCCTTNVRITDCNK